ncbi:MAG: hypothetical protein QM762_12680 [Chryseolinea sp.]
MSHSILEIISKDLATELDLMDYPTEAVEFRLIRAGMIDPSSTRSVATPAAHILPGKDMIKDKYDKKVKNKLIRNISGYKSQDVVGVGTTLIPDEEFVRFDSNGSVFVLPGEHDRWLFMKLHNKNRDNPNRNPLKAPVFYEVNEKREIAMLNNTALYRHLAASLIFNTEPDDLSEIADKVQKYFPEHAINSTLDYEPLLSVLASIAETTPTHMILAVKEPRSLARLLAEEAVHRKKLVFDDSSDKLQWRWRRSVGEKGKPAIVNLAPGNTPMKGLVDYLTSEEGSEHFAELKMLAEDYYPKPR